MSLSSSRFAEFTGVRRMGRRDHPASLGSLGFDMVFSLGVVRYIRCHWVHRGAPWESFGSSGVAGFTGVRPVCRRFHPGSLGSLGCAQGIVGFIWVVFFPGVRPLGVGIIRVGWVHLDAPLVSSGSSGFSGVRPWSPRV